MQRIEFQVHFQEIVYKSKPKKAFSIRLAMQDQEGSELASEEIGIPLEQTNINLGQLASFNSYFVINEDKACFRPHSLYFIANLTPIITRKIPLRLGKIYDHHKSTPNQQLEQIYTFQQGKVLYNVTVDRSYSITDPQQIQTYEFKFIQFGGSICSSKIIMQSQLRQTNRNSPKRLAPKPSFQLKTLEECEDKLDEEATKDIDDEAESERGDQSGVEYMRSWHQLEVTEEQIRQCDKTNADIVQQEANQKSLFIKIIVVLLAIGFLIMALSAYDDPKKSIKGKAVRKGAKNGRKQKQHKKELMIKHR